MLGQNGCNVRGCLVTRFSSQRHLRSPLWSDLAGGGGVSAVSGHVLLGGGHSQKGKARTSNSSLV